MPLVKGDQELTTEQLQDIHETSTGRPIPDAGELLQGRIKNTRKLLRTAALIMSVMLITSSFVTAALIPAEKFAEDGEANGRAISYLRNLGQIAVVLVEQYLDFAQELGDNFVVMDRGAVVYACTRATMDEFALKRALAL